MLKINLVFVDIVIHIIRVTSNIDQILYVIMKSIEIFTSQSIRKLSSNDIFRISDISVNEEIVTLDAAIQYHEAFSSTTSFVISSTLNQPYLKLYIQFNRNS